MYIHVTQMKNVIFESLHFVALEILLHVTIWDIRKIIVSTFVSTDALPSKWNFPTSEFITQRKNTSFNFEQISNHTESHLYRIAM